MLCLYVVICISVTVAHADQQTKQRKSFCFKTFLCFEYSNHFSRGPTGYLDCCRIYCPRTRRMIKKMIQIKSCQLFCNRTPLKLRTYLFKNWIGEQSPLMLIYSSRGGSFFRCSHHLNPDEFINLSCTIMHSDDISAFEIFDTAPL